jgi:hypothetical protein
MQRKNWLLGATTMVLLAAFSAPAYSQAGDNAPESADKFMQRYYQTLHNATSLMTMKPFYPPRKEDAKMEEEIKAHPELAAFALEMVKGEPEKVKVVSKKEEGDKVIYSLVPDMIPPQFADQAKQPGFSMTGELILVKKDASWLVQKDYWTVKSKDKDGSSTTSFGHNPKSDSEQQGDK